MHLPESADASAEHAQGSWWLRATLEVHHDALARDPRPGDLVVGIGTQGADGLHVVLNHKSAGAGGAGARALPGATSVSGFVWHAPEALRESWRRCFPQGMASVKRIVVEDASLDTCMALLLFAREVSVERELEAAALGALQTHCSGSDGAQQRLTSWIAYVTGWEEGRYSDGEDFERSAGCLMAALAHSFLAGSQEVAHGRSLAVASALRACLTLLDAYIAVNAEAIDARSPRHVAEHEQAQAQLGFELQLYELALKHGVQTQLLLPLASSQRRLLVDALIVEDLEISGLLKVLARNDRVHSSTRRGFGLLALHRPQEAGTGNDMVLSVDPRLGVSLEALWQRLEAGEDKAWGGARPCDASRRGIVRYTDPATGAPRAGAPNQPWYDEQGRYTLIAAPKTLGDGRPGSRLSWKGDVLPALWDAFRPFDTPTIEIASAHGRHVATVKWPPGMPHKADGLPVHHQWLAACAGGRTPAHPGEFVPLAELCIRRVPGGEVVAHAAGVTLSDDWTSAPLDPALADAASAMADIAGRYDALLDSAQLARLAAQLQSLMDAGRLAGEKRLLELRKATLDLKRDLIELAVREEQLQTGAGHRALLEALEQAWDLPGARHRLWDTAVRMEELLAQAQALHQARAQFFMTRIVSAAGLFIFVHEFIGALAGIVTLGETERLLIVAEKLGVAPDRLAELQHSATLAGVFDWSAMAAWALIAIGAPWLAWRHYRGGRGSGPAPHQAAGRR